MCASERLRTSLKTTDKTMRKTVLSGAIALSLLSFNIHALSVGEMNVSSHLGEALNVTIDLNTASKSELSTLEVSLASRDSFKQAGIRYPENPNDLIIEVDTKRKGKPRILVKSLNSISDPFVHLLLKISWAGGNMLREYTALIDPVEYSPKPAAQAVSASTKLGVVKSTNNAVAANKTGGDTPKVHGIVKNGDSLSAIASLYRPADVSIHQAWMAFYALNREAFPENNLNRIKKGSEIRVPTRAQMTAVSPSKAAQEVKKLSQPLGGSARAKSPATKAAPKLVVGGGKDEEPARAAKKSTQETSKDKQATTKAGLDQLASVKAEFSEFKEAFARQLGEANEQNVLIKEQLVASRGESRVLNERIVELEKQLSNINHLLELQSEAMQALTENIDKNAQLQLAAVNGANTESEKEIASDAAASTADEDDAKAVMLESGQPSSGGTAVSNDTPSADEAKDGQTSADSDIAQDGTPQAAVDSKEPIQTQLAQNEQSLEQKLEERIEADQQQAQDAQVQVETAQTNTAEQPQATIAKPDSVSTTAVVPKLATPRIETERSFIDKAKDMLASIPADIWKIIGVIAAALLGLFVFSNSRRRREEQLEDEDYEFSTLEAEAVADQEHKLADDSSQAMMDTKSSLKEKPSDDQLHGSSLFDLSDESFMASESADNDSSMFTMDDEFGASSDKMASSGTAVSGLHSSIPTATDIDPVTEADVYLAYDRKEQAINVLEQALEKDPNQNMVVMKLLTLHRDAGDIDSFTKLYESSAEIVKDEEQWGEIKLLAEDFIPAYKLEDDFDSSIPVLRDELVVVEKQADSAGLHDIESGSIDLNDDDILDRAIQELEDENIQLTDKPEVIDISDGDDLDFSIEEEMEKEASLSLAENKDGIFAEDTGGASDSGAYDIGLDIEHEEGLDRNPDLVTKQNFEQELDSELQEVNQHDPETALALAKAYIELGENDIAKDFLNDVIVAGSKKVKGEAQKLLAAVS